MDGLDRLQVKNPLFYRLVCSGIVCLFALSTSAEPARAAEPGVALAQSLFEEGRRLMKQGDYASACPKLVESQRLEPAPGTLLNLALCHELQGKLATAWQEFLIVRADAQRAKRADRERSANERIRALEPRLPHLTVVLPATARLDGLRVTLDGIEVGEAAFGVATPVDPGVHVLQAHAPTHLKESREVALAEAQSLAVEVPALKPESRAPVPAASAPSAAVFSESEQSAQPSRTIGWCVGAGGLVALGVGSYFGLRTLSKMSSSDDHCVNGCDAAGAEFSRQAATSARVADVALGLGVVALGVSAYLLLRPVDSAAGASARVQTLRLSTYGSASGGGLGIQGSW